MARTNKANKLALIPKRKQMWIYSDKWVELHNRVTTLEHQVLELENQLKQNLIKNELYPNK